MPVEDAFGSPLWAGEGFTKGQDPRFRAALALLMPPTGDLPDWLWPILAERLELIVLGYERWFDEYGRQPLFGEVRRRLKRIAALTAELAALTRQLSPWERERLAELGAPPLNDDGDPLRAAWRRDAIRYPPPERELVRLLPDIHDPSEARHDLAQLHDAYGSLAEGVGGLVPTQGGRRRALPWGMAYPPAMLAFDCALLLLYAGAKGLAFQSVLALTEAAHRLAMPAAGVVEVQGLHDHVRATLKMLDIRPGTDGWPPSDMGGVDWAELEQKVAALYEKHERCPLWRRAP